MELYFFSKMIENINASSEKRIILIAFQKLILGMNFGYKNKKTGENYEKDIYIINIVLFGCYGLCPKGKHHNRTNYTGKIT